MFGAAAISPAFAVNMRIVPLLLILGSLRQCFVPRVRLHNQRRQGKRLNRFDAFSP